MKLLIILVILVIVCWMVAVKFLKKIDNCLMPCEECEHESYGNQWCMYKKERPNETEAILCKHFKRLEKYGLAK